MFLMTTFMAILIELYYERAIIYAAILLVVSGYKL